MLINCYRLRCRNVSRALKMELQTVCVNTSGLYNTLTTLPHYLSAWIAMINGHVVYSILIFTATTSSAAWHWTDGQIPFFLDHALAIIWGFTDTWILPSSLIFNIPIIFLYFTMKQHWKWHLLSATKSVIVVLMMVYDSTL